MQNFASYRTTPANARRRRCKDVIGATAPIKQVVIAFLIFLTRECHLPGSRQENSSVDGPVVVIFMTISGKCYRDRRNELKYLTD